MPGISARRRLRLFAAQRAGSRPSGRACRDAPGGRTARRSAASSILRPAYITMTRWQVSATTPRSWVIRMTAAPVRLLQLQHQVEDLRLDGDVERGGRLVGDQQRRIAGQRHGDHHALAHAAGELVRIVVERGARRRGCCTSRSISTRALARLRAALAPVWMRTRLGDLVADGEHRIEAGHRLLEDHGDAGCRAARASRLSSSAEEVAVLEA